MRPHLWLGSSDKCTAVSLVGIVTARQTSLFPKLRTELYLGNSMHFNVWGCGFCYRPPFHYIDQEW